MFSAGLKSLGSENTANHFRFDLASITSADGWIGLYSSSQTSIVCAACSPHYVAAPAKTC